MHPILVLPKELSAKMKGNDLREPLEFNTERENPVVTTKGKQVWLCQVETMDFFWFLFYLQSRVSLDL